MADRSSTVSLDTTASPGHGFGTAPVFLASISTILGAILFLRFGYAVGNVGLWGTLLIIMLGHLVTIPTVLAVSEIATNRRVAGGGAYFIVSRSFGARIGGAIGIALYLSQAISIAFYLVAFAEALEPVYGWLAATYDLAVDPRFVSLPATLLLVGLVLKRGASFAVKSLWIVSVVLGLSIVMLLLGQAPESMRPDGLNLTARIASGDSFSMVFAICFPAFTGMIGGLGLSGDLRNPQKSIPLGIIGATLAGLLIYVLVAIKLAQSATPELLAADQFVMTQIALWGPSIYVGLGAAALSSAFGSILVAPRTLQALARDNVLPARALNRLIERGYGSAHEPLIATCVSAAIAIVFVLAGGVDFIAPILSMFFLVTYGALCAVSFLEYFAGNPSYRPTFRSRWYVALVGAVMCGILMIQMNAFYAFVAFGLMAAIYLGLRHSQKGERDLTAIFQGAMFQLTRRLQITLQKNHATGADSGWRPSIIALTRYTERRLGHFDLLRWISHRHGFGHFIRFSEGDYSDASKLEAQRQVRKMIERSQVTGAGVFVDTLVCPSIQSALGVAMQLPGISGLPNNCILLEFDRNRPKEREEVSQCVAMAVESRFNMLILRSTKYRFGYRSSIHVWVTEDNLTNAPMMLLLAYIIVGHPEWKRAQINLFVCLGNGDSEREAHRLSDRLQQGRMPIAPQNVTSISCDTEESLEKEITSRSAETSLVIAGLAAARLSPEASEIANQLDRYRGVNDVLFVSAVDEIQID